MYGDTLQGHGEATSCQCINYSDDASRIMAIVVKMAETTNSMAVYSMSLVTWCQRHLARAWQYPCRMVPRVP